MEYNESLHILVNSLGLVCFIANENRTYLQYHSKMSPENKSYKSTQPHNICK